MVIDEWGALALMLWSREVGEYNLLLFFIGDFNLTETLYGVHCRIND